jgi:hypothetical protein
MQLCARGTGCSSYGIKLALAVDSRGIAIQNHHSPLHPVAFRQILPLCSSPSVSLLPFSASRSQYRPCQVRLDSTQSKCSYSSTESTHPRPCYCTVDSCLLFIEVIVAYGRIDAEWTNFNGSERLPQSRTGHCAFCCERRFLRINICYITLFTVIDFLTSRRAYRN